MDFGKNMPDVPQKAICNEIYGCTSRVEICRYENRFYAVADSAIVRGIVYILISMVDGKTPREIKNMDLKSEFDSLKLNLGISRIGGVNSMINFLQNL